MRATRRALFAATLALPAVARAQGDGITIVDDTLRYPEGPLIQGLELLVADMSQHRLIGYDLGTLERTRVIELPACGPTSIAPFGEGRMVVLCHLAQRLLLLSPDGEILMALERTLDGAPIRAPNDSVEDGSGGVFLSDAGVFSNAAPATGKVLHVSQRGARTVVDGLRYSNGVAWQAEGRVLYVSEHLANRILRFELDAEMRVTGRSVFFDLATLPAPQGTPYDQTGPDGLELLPDGDLLAAQYGGGRFMRFSAQGALKAITDVPCQFITNITRHEDEVFFVGARDIRAAEVRGMLGRVALR